MLFFSLVLSVCPILTLAFVLMLHLARSVCIYYFQPRPHAFQSEFLHSRCSAIIAHKYQPNPATNKYVFAFTRHLFGDGLAHFIIRFELFCFVSVGRFFFLFCGYFRMFAIYWGLLLLLSVLLFIIVSFAVHLLSLHNFYLSVFFGCRK